MPENMPTDRAYLTPAQVQLAFDYVLAVDAANDDAADQLADGLLPHIGLLVTIGEELVFPVTGLPDNVDDSCANSFVVDEDELGVLCLMMIRRWASNCPVSAAPAIARCIAHFVARVFVTDP